VKYIISENRLHEFMFNYLNDLIKRTHVLNRDSFIVISPIITYEEEWDDYMEYDYSDGRLWISFKLISMFSDMFALDQTDAGNFIKNWFEKRYDVKVTYVEFSSQ